MLVLGIETSTPQASVTIGSEQGIIGSSRQVPGGVTRLTDYQVGPPERLATEFDAQGSDVLAIGNGALLYRSKLEEAERVEIGTMTHAFPRSAALIDLALPRIVREDFDRLYDIEPLYMRRTQAEINWEARSPR